MRRFRSPAIRCGWRKASQAWGTFRPSRVAKTRHATEWRLLIYPQGSEAVAPKNFMRWQPQPIAKPAQELSEDEKKQNAVRVAQLLVSVVKPLGARGATERSEIGPDDACGETVEAEKRASQFH